MLDDVDERGRRPRGRAFRLHDLTAARLALAACCALAAFLAFWNLGFGLPFLFRPDEEVMVGRAVRMAVEHSLDPLFYIYPPVAFYFLAAVEAAVGALPGGHLGPATRVDPTLEYLAARSLSALATVVAVGLTWTIGRRAYGARAASLGAAALAVAPLAVRQAHFATTDALELGLVALALWAGARAEAARGYALAGALCAAAAATKYTAAASLVFVVVLALRGRRRAALTRTAAALAAFGLTLPLLFLPTGHGRAFLDGLTFLGARAGAFASMPPGWLYHPTHSLPYGLGLGSFALALLGVGVAAGRRTPTDLALLAYLAAGFLPLAVSHEVFFRYALPLLPALGLLAGRTLRELPPRLEVPAVAACVLLLLPSAWNSFQGDRLLGATDTRAQAAAWLEANAPAGSSIAVDNYWAQPFYDSGELGGNPLHPLYASRDPVADSFQQGRFTTRFRMLPGGSAPASGCYRLLESNPPWQAPDWAPGTAGLAATFSPGRPEPGAVYDPLDAFYLPIWGFGGIERPGPAIAVRAGC